jgi:phosphatidylinositol alpha-1,6-mannosyltransferase
MPRRILLMTHEFPPFLGGIATYGLDLARAASQLGHDVTVLAPSFGAGAAIDDSEPFRVIRHHGGSYRAWRLPWLLRHVLKLVDLDEYDVVHAAEWPYLLALGLLKPYTKRPFIATLHGSEVLRNRQGILRGRLPLGSIYTSPERVLTNSEYTKRILLESYPSVPDAQVHVTPLGVAEYWFCDPGSSDVRERCRIPEGRRIILTVGRLDTRKGHLLALEALDRLPAAQAKLCCYVVVGKGDDAAYRRALESRAANCIVETIFTGAIRSEDLRALYREADVFCLPAEPDPMKVEGFGLAYLEAAAQGLPSVGSHTGAVPEVVVDGETGILIRPRDAVELGLQLERLLADEDVRRGLGERARAHAATFTWQRTARLTYDS